jgi:FkbM family methyltransferase
MSILYEYVNKTSVSVIDEAVFIGSAWTIDNTVWELNVIQKFVDQIQDNFVILDLGTQTGSFSVAAKYFPNTQWHSFEPDPYSYNILVKNLLFNEINNVSLYEEALSDKIEDSILNIHPPLRGLNTLGKNIIRFPEYESIQHSLKTNTIDNLFLNTKIDLIKMDTEGCEYNIIKGGLETIKKYKPKILLECCGNLNQFDYTEKDLYNLIQEINYEVFWTDKGENIFIQSK